MKKTMDRRQRKSRQAIFAAFISLLSEKNVNKITVNDIIDRADVGRATFYAHFETKDFLIKELCDELFCHVFDCINNKHSHKHIFECDEQNSVFLHLFTHLQKNDNNILTLFSCKNNELFLEYFKNGLMKLVTSQKELFTYSEKLGLPADYWTNHITSTFVQTLKWWVENGTKESPEKITSYFLKVINAPA